MMVSIEIPKELTSLFQTGSKELKKDIKQAVNELAMDTKNQIYRQERKTYALKAYGYKKSDLKIKKATNTKLEAEIRSEGEVLSLKKFYRTRPNGKRVAAKAMVLKRTGRPKPIEKNGKKAFTTSVTATGRDGSRSKHEGIFVRQTKKRLPIEALFGPSAGKITEKVFEPMQEEVEDRLKERVNALIAFGG